MLEGALKRFIGRDLIIKECRANICADYAVAPPLDLLLTGARTWEHPKDDVLGELHPRRASSFERVLASYSAYLGFAVFSSGSTTAPPDPPHIARMCRPRRH